MARKRKNDDPQMTLPTEERRSDDDRYALELRCSMTPRTRMLYAEVVSGQGPTSPGAAREDAWHRAVEFLFERLVVGWTIDGVTTEGQRDLLQRFRAAGPEERAWVRDALRGHLAEWFPEMQAP